jgi:hypothetical protein
MTLGALAQRRLDGTEPFHIDGVALGFDVRSVWQFSHSDLQSNTERAKVAEALVGHALGLSLGTPDWEGCDLITATGHRVEVKSSAFLQSWKQKRLSTVSFSIQKARAWNAATDSWTPESARYSDVYVFCLHHHRDKRTVDARNLAQWTFFVLRTRTIDQYFGEQASVDVGELETAGAHRVTYGALAATIRLLTDDPPIIHSPTDNRREQ